MAAGTVTLLLAAGCLNDPTPPAPATPSPATPSPGPAAPAGPDPADQPRFPIRAAFFYAWFPESWEQGSQRPFTRFRPVVGYYDSGTRETLAAQVAALSYGGFQAAIVSWWGPGEKHESERVPALLAAAAQVDPRIRFALYYEAEGAADPTVESLVRDLEYVRVRYTAAGNHLRVDGRPVLFVYNSGDRDCSVVDRWSAATAIVDFYVVLKVFPGWSTCRSHPDGWHQYAPAQPYVEFRPEDPAVSGSVSISPGFWRATDGAPIIPRDLRRWRGNVAAMTASNAQWHLVTTFNEWGEGTAVEGAAEWSSASGQGLYLDALRSNGE